MADKTIKSCAIITAALAALVIMGVFGFLIRDLIALYKPLATEIKINQLPTITAIAKEETDQFYCNESEVQKAINQFEDIFERMKRIAEIGSDTGSLGIVPEIKAIRTEAENLEVPECAEPAKGKLIDLLNAVVESLLAIELGASSEIIDEKIEQIEDMGALYDIELTKLKNR